MKIFDSPSRKHRDRFRLTFNDNTLKDSPETEKNNVMLECDRKVK